MLRKGRKELEYVEGEEPRGAAAPRLLRDETELPAAAGSRRELHIPVAILADGGELPAMILTDVVARFVPGVLGSPESARDESFSDGLLEYPQYTRPQVYEGLSVPEVLLSGHHENIEKWRREQSLLITRKNRPDLLENK